MPKSIKNVQLLSDLLSVRYAIMHQNRFKALAKLQVLKNDAGLNGDKFNKSLLNSKKSLSNKKDSILLYFYDAYLACKQKDFKQAGIAIKAIKENLGLSRKHFTLSTAEKLYQIDVKRMVENVINDVDLNLWTNSLAELELIQNYYHYDFSKEADEIRNHDIQVKADLKNFLKKSLTNSSKEYFNS